MIHSRRVAQSIFRAASSRSSQSFSVPRIKPVSVQFIVARNFSDVSGPSDPQDSTDKLQSAIDSLQVVVDEKAVDAAVAVANVAVEPAGFVATNLMAGVDWIHNFAGVPYWEAIVIGTMLTRILMFYPSLRTVQSTARMAVMRPEMQKIQDAMNADPNINDGNTRMRYAAEMKALFVKYQANPLRALMWPFAQFPVFIGIFWALKDMGLYYPGLATGGDYWFTDLTAPDPYYILPVINSAMFLAMIELGANDGIQLEQRKTFITAMRALGVIMIPATMSFNQGLLIYWVTNSVLSVGQTLFFKNNAVRKFFNIPNPPKPEDTPTFKPKSPVAAIKEMIEASQKRAQEKEEGLKAEIIDGKTKPQASSQAPKANAPPVTFATPPKKK